MLWYDDDAINLALWADSIISLAVDSVLPASQNITTLADSFIKNSSLQRIDITVDDMLTVNYLATLILQRAGKPRRMPHLFVLVHNKADLAAMLTRCFLDKKIQGVTVRAIDTTSSTYQGSRRPSSPLPTYPRPPFIPFLANPNMPTVPLIGQPFLRQVMPPTPTSTETTAEKLARVRRQLNIPKTAPTKLSMGSQGTLV